LIFVSVAACLLSACDELYFKSHLIGVEIEPAALTLKEGDTGTLTAFPIPRKEEFTGPSWSSSDDSIVTVSNGTVTAVAAGTATIIVTSNEGFSGTCAVTVRKKVTVTFDANNGGLMPAASIDAALGDRITEPADPTNYGMVFCGWYKDLDSANNTAAALTDKRWNFGRDTVNSDITLYARWLSTSTNPRIYTVTFDAKGGSPTPPPIRNVTENEKISQPANPEKFGRYSVFGGWYRDSDAKSDRWNFSAPVTGNMTLYAQWLSYDTPTYTVQFISEGKIYAAVQGLASGSLVPRPADPSIPGNTFVGWSTSTSSSVLWNFDTRTVNGNITLYARWMSGTPVTYTVTFDKNGGDTEASPKTKTVKSPATTVGTLPTPPTRADYKFAGWYTVSASTGGSEFTASTPVTYDQTVYARWTAMTEAEKLAAALGLPLTAVSGNTVTLNANITIGTADISIKNNVTLVIPSGRTLTISSGKKLTVEGGGQLTADGNVTVNGTLTVYSAAYSNNSPSSSNGNLAGSGTLTVEAGGKLEIPDPSTPSFSGGGTIALKPSAELFLLGTNSGTQVYYPFVGTSSADLQLNSGTLEINITGSGSPPVLFTLTNGSMAAVMGNRSPVIIPSFTVGALAKLTIGNGSPATAIIDNMVNNGEVEVTSGSTLNVTSYSGSGIKTGW